MTWPSAKLAVISTMPLPTAAINSWPVHVAVVRLTTSLSIVTTTVPTETAVIETAVVAEAVKTSPKPWE